MSIQFENYSDFEEWCLANGYDPEEEVDLEESSHKRDTLRTFYLENSVSGLYACVTLIASYDWGYGDIEVTEGFVRRAIVTTKYVYEK